MHPAEQKSEPYFQQIFIDFYEFIAQPSFVFSLLFLSDVEIILSNCSIFEKQRGNSLKSIYGWLIIIESFWKLKTFV